MLAEIGGLLRIITLFGHFLMSTLSEIDFYQVAIMSIFKILICDEMTHDSKI